MKNDDYPPFTALRSDFDPDGDFTLAVDIPTERNWVPACGGTETPFVTRTGRKLLYVWDTRTGDHAYLDCMTDIILSYEEEQFEFLGNRYANPTKEKP